MNAKIALTVPLVDQILFAMEDQENFSVLNLETRQVQVCLSEESLENPALVPLPEWNSIDGFRMMREFSENLRNPALQAELKAILDSGMGVFRRFKNALKPFDSIFRQWTRFKRTYMEGRIREWVDDWAEVMSWEALVPPGHDTELLTAQDFQVRPGTGDDAGVLGELDGQALAEAGTLAFGEADSEDFAPFWRQDGIWRDHDRLWIARGPGDEVVGLVWARPRVLPSGLTTEVLLWYVKPEYRGLGIGRTLLERLVSQSVQAGDRRLVLRPWGRNEALVPLLTRSGFAHTGSLWVSQGHKNS